MNLLNRAVFGKAFYRCGKKLNVIPVLEKETQGRWHYHAAIEPPTHLENHRFTALIHDCWGKTHWGYDQLLVREDADYGWVNYILKFSQKSGFDAWSDCIDWYSLENKPVAGV